MPRSPEELLSHIRRSVVGAGAMMPGPFGMRPVIYADYTASGRALDFIEDAMRETVMPFYANTHTETSYTGLQTTRFREAAREAIRRAVGADDHHAVIFCGSGATAAINKLVQAMGLRTGTAAGEKPVVFIGPYEHHSNDLMWRESAVTLVRIPLDEEGRLCFGTLESELERHADRKMKIGSFSAASNVTGIKTDMRRLGALLHGHGAWFCCDYAAGGPYLPIAMGESMPGANDHCDAIFLSPHKFVGGPGASGVLVADRRLLTNEVPTVPGGGTVAYVHAGMHRYVSDIERREEAGTPAILGDIRAGLALQLKADMGAERIEALERAAVARVLAAWTEDEAIEILGPRDAERLAIFSFNIRHGGRYLHPNFVVALLNDLFGIQARGGCSCAGPYAHDLLNISAETAGRYDALVQRGLSAFRPGWVRLNINFFFDEETTSAILAAVRFVARRGADFLSIYQCDAASGRWRANGQAMAAMHGFEDLCDWGHIAAKAKATPLPFPHYLAEAERLADEARAAAKPGMDRALDTEERWFAVAEDVPA